MSVVMTQCYPNYALCHVKVNILISVIFKDCQVCKMNDVTLFNSTSSKLWNQFHRVENENKRY